MAFCFCTMTFSQENSLFSNQGQDFWEDLTLKKNDSSLLYKQLFNDKTLSKSSFLLPDYLQIDKQRVFLESENSATKHVMPVYKPKGNFKQKSIFPDNTMDHSIIIAPVKER